MRQTLADLLGRLGWPAAKAALFECYPGEGSHVDRYRPVYERLVPLRAVPSDFVLRIELREDEETIQAELAELKRRARIGP